MKKIYKYGTVLFWGSVLILLVVVSLTTNLSAQPGTVLSEQRISNLQGAFTGILDDNDYFGVSVAGIGDLDGDGVEDIVVGADGDDDKVGTGPPNCDRGAVWVLFLNTNGTVKSHQKISETQGGFTGPLNNDDRFGRAVASIGDLDGDLVPDIAVGAWGDDDGVAGAGAIWILFLNTNGTVKAEQKISQLAGGFSGSLTNGNGFGVSIEGIGDLDGDLLPDIAVGAESDIDGGTNRGAVYILFLNANGTVKAEQKISDLQGGFSGVLNDGDYFGASLAQLDDLDGDLVTDIAVGAKGDYDGGTWLGAVWVLFMNSNGTVKSHQKISDTQGNFTGTLDSYDEFGYGLSNAGDLNRDGIQDLAVGTHGDDDGAINRGAIWILFLNTDGTVAFHQKISNTEGNFGGAMQNNEFFGNDVANIGDVDNDGKDDLVSGLWKCNDGGTSRGGAWILFADEYNFQLATATGIFSDPATWVCGCVPSPTDNVKIPSGVAVTLLLTQTVNDLIIETGAAMNVTNKTLIVNGNFDVDGSLAGFTAIELNGADKCIDGTGILNNVAAININGNKTIKPNANLNQISGDLNLLGPDTIWNYGTYAVSNGDILGTVSSVWINMDNSTLNVGQALLSPNGTLIADANGNTVNYFGTAAQLITPPLNSYYHLSVSTAGNKVLKSKLDVNGNLAISGSAVLNNGIGNNDINLAGNWVNNSTALNGFVEGTGKFEFDGSANQSITNLIGQEKFIHLIINKSAGKVILNNDVWVDNRLELVSGNMDLTSNNLTLADVAGVHGTPGPLSYVQADGSGMMRKMFSSTASFTWPVGDATNYSPFDVNINTISFTATDGYLELNLTNAMHPSMGATDYITRYWTLNAVDITAIDYDVTYDYVNADITGTETDINTARWSAFWIILDPVNAATNTLTGSGITVVPSNHDFTGGNSSIILPVELVSFEALLKDGFVYSTWVTATEHNSDYFAVEHSADGITFESVGKKAAAGSSSAELHYQLTDDDPFSGLSYYRLKQVDQDGAFEYSKIITVENSVNSSSQIQIWPNPVKEGNAINLRYENPDAAVPLTVQLYNASGNRVLSSPLHLAQKRGVVIDRERLEAGVYFAMIINEIGTVMNTTKIVVIR